MKMKIPKGISYYPMEPGHTSNKRIRLLYNDHGSDGYWIWSCIIDSAYKTYGYYHPGSLEDIELLASDVCRKSPEFLLQVVDSCLKRGLFDRNVYEKSYALTSDKMQMNFLRGTYDRRRKGASVHIHEDHILISDAEIREIGEGGLVNVYLKPTGELLWRKFTSFHGNSLFSPENQENSTAKPDISTAKAGNSMQTDIILTDINSNTIPENEFSVPVDKIDLSGLAQPSKPGRKKKAPRPKNPDVEPYQELYIEIFGKNWMELREKKFNWQPKDFKAIKEISKMLRKNRDDWTMEVARSEIESLHAKAKLDSFISKNNFENYTLPFFYQRINSILSINLNGNAKKTNQGAGRETNRGGDGRTIEFDKP